MTTANNILSLSCSEHGQGISKSFGSVTRTALTARQTRVKLLSHMISVDLLAAKASVVMAEPSHNLRISPAS